MYKLNAMSNAKTISEIINFVRYSFAASSPERPIRVSGTSGVKKCIFKYIRIQHNIIELITGIRCSFFILVSSLIIVLLFLFIVASFKLAKSSTSCGRLWIIVDLHFQTAPQVPFFNSTTKSFLCLQAWYAFGMLFINGYLRKDTRCLWQNNIGLSNINLLDLQIHRFYHPVKVTLI